MPIFRTRRVFPLAIIVLTSSFSSWPNAACAAPPQTAVVCPSRTTFQEQLAAREIRRYVYLRTGKLLPVFNDDQLPKHGDAILVTRKGQSIVRTVTNKPGLKETVAKLGAQQYVLKTVRLGSRRVVLVIGGDGVGTLYGAYRLAEHLGVRFFLHGDVVPDRKVAWKLPELDEIGKPLFELRGLNPWGSHPFGFDQWSVDDYRAHLHQLAKMRMNFIGIHCYPEGHPYAEPTVWLGLPSDFDAQGRVKFSYPARYYNTFWQGHWGPMLPKQTGDYSFGGSLLFERDDWGPDVMTDLCPTPAGPERCNELFNRTGRQFREAFSFARLVGVKTCLGTEAPMTMPQALHERLKVQGKDRPAVVQQVYEGIFRRIMATHPLDYYWLWTPESWTWRGNSTDQMQATVEDVKIALAALKKVGAPFQLATCGWVLGPQNDRAAFDRMIPKDIAVSAISRVIGYEPVDPAFGDVEGRQKWAIPWLESDDYLSSPQLWVARTRKDAADALAYGCTGLMGLQWRTRVIGPNVSALAQAGWDQSGWNPAPGTLLPNTPVVDADMIGPIRRSRGTQRGLPSSDFWTDWCLALFGPEVADAAAQVFQRIDGRLPQSLGSGCPAGSLRSLNRPWEEVAPAYAFVDELANLRPRVTGAGNRQRFDYWLNTFRYLRSQARVQCALGKFQLAMNKVEQEKKPSRRKALAADSALPLYRELVRRYGEMYGYRLAAVATNGGIATIINLEHNARFWPVAIEGPGQRLSEALGATLPDDSLPPKAYHGPPRLIVPTVRSVLLRGESLTLKVIALASAPPTTLRIHWRSLGESVFSHLPATHVARGVYQAVLEGKNITNDFEYYIEMATAIGIVKFPATAPTLSQTVIVIDAAR